jgi:hypothetical protein
MEYLRDDFDNKDKPVRCVSAEMNCGAEIYAVYANDGTFFVSFSEKGIDNRNCEVDGWWFDLDGIDDALLYFSRLKTIILQERNK